MFEVPVANESNLTDAFASGLTFLVEKYKYLRLTGNLFQPCTWKAKTVKTLSAVN